MSLCLIKILKEWIGILFVAFSSLFINDHKTENITVAYNINNFVELVQAYYNQM